MLGRPQTFSLLATLVFGLLYAGPALAAAAMIRGLSRGTAPELTWIVVKSVLAAGTELWAMYALAVYCLAPPAANRAKHLRLTLTGLLLAWMGLVFLDSSEGWTVLVIVIMELLLLVGLVFGLTSGARLSRRVRCEVPTHAPGRLFALLFFSGAFSAWLWTLLMATLLQGWLLLCQGVLPFPTYFWSTALRVCLMLNGYLLVYVLLAHILNHRFPRIPLTAAFAGTVAVGTLLPMCLIPLMCHDWAEVHFPLLGDVAACAWDTQSHRYFGAHVIFMACVAVVALWLLRARIADTVRDLQPLPPPGGGPEDTARRTAAAPEAVP